MMNIFTLIVCCCSMLFVAMAIPYPSHGFVNTGQSSVQRSEDGYGNYMFGYNEDHATGGTFRKEKGGPGYQTGSYGLRDADGRMRIVHYVADALGFRATVSTNEPGTDVKQDPAATSLTYSHSYSPMALMAPPTLHSGGLYAAPSSSFPISSYYAPEPMYAKSTPYHDLQLAPSSYALSQSASSALFPSNHYLPEAEYLAETPFQHY